ncbi:MAG: hypothetical protein GXO07_03395 [Crenarchaeota archaeon]|nr:hypothetical protein [Thermoproteota archaeon]
MIAEVAILVTLALLSLPRPVALASFSLASLSGIVGCEVVCMEWVSPFLSSAVLGFFISILSFVLGLDPASSFLLDALASAAIALAFAKKFLEGGLEGVAEWAAVLLILASVGLAYASPEAATQAMLSLGGSLWVVDPQAALLLTLTTAFIMLVSSAYKPQLAAAMFDHEYLMIMSKRPLFWVWMLFFFVVLGTSYASFAVGLLSAQVLLVLPAALSLKARLKEVEVGAEATYALALAVILAGLWASYSWGLPEVGLAGAILILLIVSLDLLERIGKVRLLIEGLRRGSSPKGDEQQEAEG